MVLYYGLLALETANNTATSTAAALERASVSRKPNPTEKMSSSSNSWIYTEDLKKRFEERYTDYRYIFVPVYVNGKNSRQNHSTTIIPQISDNENSWMYSRSLRDHLFYSTSKISSSTCCVTNQTFTRDQLPVKKPSKARFFKRPSSSSKAKSTTNLPRKFSPHTSSSSSFHTTYNITKHRTNIVVEEDDDENENHSVPLIKQDSTVSSQTTTQSSNNNNTPVTTTINNATPHSNTLTRLRSFFFKPSSSLSGTEQQQTTSLSSSSLNSRNPKT